jgi:hypothetical protein
MTFSTFLHSLGRLKPYKDYSSTLGILSGETHSRHGVESRAEAQMENLVELANGPDTAPEAVEVPVVKALVTSLNTNSMYWHGARGTSHPLA